MKKSIILFTMSGLFGTFALSSCDSPATDKESAKKVQQWIESEKASELYDELKQENAQEVGSSLEDTDTDWEEIFDDLDDIDDYGEKVDVDDYEEVEEFMEDMD